MSDEVSRILEEVRNRRASAIVKAGVKAAIIPNDTQPIYDDSDAAAFDSSEYLRVNPDIADAVRRGEFQSAHHHYVMHGLREGRRAGGWPRDSRNVVLPSAGHGGNGTEAATAPACGFEALIISASGGLMLIGWLDDTNARLECIHIVGTNWRVVIDAPKIMRLRRPDVEAALGRGPNYAYGLVAFLWTGQTTGLKGQYSVEYWLAKPQGSGVVHAQPCIQIMTPRHVDDIEGRNTLLTYLAGAAFVGNTAVEAMTAVGGGMGDEIVAANRVMTSNVVATVYAERFGQRPRPPRGSIVVVLYGKPEFMFLQNALYAALPGIGDYEFVFVCNSPEIAEAVLREARRSDLIYGLPQTVVVLAGNAGFGAANNVGAAHARSKRLLIVNPDVFPRDLDWARKHTDLLDAARPEECRLFGVPMFYDDGSLMHGGMYYEIDRGLSLAGGTPRTVPMVRVEHFGKGAPPGAERYLQPRPVPAVGGAFISCDRAWYETLGGFTEDYVFGHYEDADLCLKSLERGTPPWLQDIRMWHLEGKGSTRLPPHEGATIVNRWLFSKRWAGAIEADILGQTPRHTLLRMPRAAAPAPPPNIPTVLRAVGSLSWSAPAAKLPIAARPMQI